MVVGLQPLACLQFDVGDHEVQLQPTLVGVLDPKDRILVSGKTRHECLFCPGHYVGLSFLGDVWLFERQHAAGVLASKRRGVDDLNHLVSVPSHDASVRAISVFAKQVVNGTAAATSAMRVEFNEQGERPASRCAGAWRGARSSRRPRCRRCSLPGRSG